MTFSLKCPNLSNQEKKLSVSKFDASSLAFHQQNKITYRGAKRKNVVGDKECPVVPNNCVVGIFQLIGNEIQNDALGFWVIREHSSFVGNRHGSLFPSNRGIDEVLNHMSALPSEIRNDKSGEGVDTNVSGQDISIGFVSQNWMDILLEQK